MSLMGAKEEKLLPGEYIRAEYAREMHSCGLTTPRGLNAQTNEMYISRL